MGTGGVSSAVHIQPPTDRPKARPPLESQNLQLAEPVSDGSRDVRSLASSAHRDTATAQGPQLQTSRAFRRRRGIALTRWNWEISSLLVAIALLISIFATLAKYNGEKQPAWRYDINLNSLIAVLSTVLRAMVVVIVTEVISQLKWAWYQLPRRLRDLDMFDQASRGPWGSILLLVATREIHLAILGCCIYLVSFAIGPFTQQSIKSIPCNKLVIGVNSSLPIAKFVSVDSLLQGGFSDSFIDLGMRGAVINRLANLRGNDSTISATCPTGNCTFTSYNGITHSSIGFCSKCMDSTLQIRETARSPLPGSFYTLPNGLSLTEGITLSERTFLNVSFGDSTAATKFPFWHPSNNVTVLSFTTLPCTSDHVSGTTSCPHRGLNFQNLTNIDIVAATCTLYPCLKDYYAEFRNGSLREEVISTTELQNNTRYTFPDSKGVSYDINSIRIPCVVNGLQYDIGNFSKVPDLNNSFVLIQVDGKNVTAPQQCHYKMDEDYLGALIYFLDQALTGDCVSSYNSSNLDLSKNSNPNNRLLNGVECPNWWLTPLYNSGNASMETISKAMDDLTTSITNRIRITGFDSTGLNQGLVNGTVYETAVCTRFDWYWLLFPVSLLALATILLILAILGGRYQPIWKSSILPLLFCGFGRQDQEHLGKPVELDDMYVIADNTTVDLSRNVDKAWRIWFERELHKERLEHQASKMALSFERDCHEGTKKHVEFIWTTTKRIRDLCNGENMHTDASDCGIRKMEFEMADLMIDNEAKQRLIEELRYELRGRGQAGLFCEQEMKHRRTVFEEALAAKDRRISELEGLLQETQFLQGEHYDSERSATPKLKQERME
ncbi:MAG: hypothetical protein M1839_009336 [Geoglossum umbratile]|nr:MAG: hypothetical protein M1839_009336 [Geoglossum umbratile]